MLKINIVNNQHGVTLLELLAVLVILGVISGIAVPNISKIIENAKIDTHIANARVAVAATRFYMIAENPSLDYYNASLSTKIIRFNELQEKGYIGEFISPTNKRRYHPEASYVIIYKFTNGGYDYFVRLTPERNNGSFGNFYLSKLISQLEREDVRVNAQ